MKISIITVVYNNENTIEQAISSVSAQTYGDIEYIIIDGKSNDGTISILNKHRDKIDVFVSESDRGIYDAMNKGVSAATGELIGLLNSDDIYQDEHVISDVVAKFVNDPTIDIVYGDLVYVKKDDVSKVVRKWQSKPYGDNFFERGHVPPHPALFLTRKVYEKAGLFKLDFKLAADYEFMLRVFKKFNFRSIYYPRLLVRMRLGGATNQSISNVVNGNREIIRAWSVNGLKVPLLLMPLRIFKRLSQFF